MKKTVQNCNKLFVFHSFVVWFEGLGLLLFVCFLFCFWGFFLFFLGFLVGFFCCCFFVFVVCFLMSLLLLLIGSYSGLYSVIS